MAVAPGTFVISAISYMYVRGQKPGVITQFSGCVYVCVLSVIVYCWSSRASPAATESGGLQGSTKVNEKVAVTDLDGFELTPVPLTVTV